jgi:hypothetical protein
LTQLTGIYDNQNIVLRAGSSSDITTLISAPPDLSFLQSAAQKRASYLPNGVTSLTSPTPCPYAIKGLDKYWSQRSRYGSPSFLITPLTNSSYTAHSASFAKEEVAVEWGLDDAKVLSSWYSITPEVVSLFNSAYLTSARASTTTGELKDDNMTVILEPFTGVGRDTISLSSPNTLVIACELSFQSLLTASKNCELEGVRKEGVVFVVGDGVQVMELFAGRRNGGNSGVNGASEERNLRHFSDNELLNSFSRTAEGYVIVTNQPHLYPDITPLQTIINTAVTSSNERTGMGKINKIDKIFLSPPWNNTSYYKYSSDNFKNGTSSNVKKSVCRMFAKGKKCKYGNKCNFLHQSYKRKDVEEGYDVAKHVVVEGGANGKINGRDLLDLSKAVVGCNWDGRKGEKRVCYYLPKNTITEGFEGEWVEHKLNGKVKSAALFL